MFERQHLLDVWEDGKIRISSFWDDDIKQAMSNARLAVLLLTKEAFESQYILNTELPFRRERQQRYKLPVFPVVCEKRNWKDYEWLRATQAPNESNPLSQISEAAQDRVLRKLATDIAEELSRAVLAELPKPDQPLPPDHVYLNKFPLARGGEFGARQLAVLRMLGLFDRPADAGCIGALRKPPAIVGLTDPLFTTRHDASTGQPTVHPLLEEYWNTATSFLADSGLVAIQGGLVIERERYDWKNATIRCINLSELNLALGNINAALDAISASCDENSRVAFLNTCIEAEQRTSEGLAAWERESPLLTVAFNQHILGATMRYRAIIEKSAFVSVHECLAKAIENLRRLAEKLINDYGYHRRDEELADAKRAIFGG